MTALTTQKVVDAGTAPSFAQAASVSDTAQVGNGINTFLVYKNTGTQKTITIVAPGSTEYGQPFPDPAIILPATTGEKWIPLRKAYDPADGSGRATITMTPDATGVTVAVVQVG
jgi:hypothetical protein